MSIIWLINGGIYLRWLILLMPATGLAKGSCQSGAWKGQLPTRVNIIVGTDETCGGPDAVTVPIGMNNAVAICPSNQLLVGGGYQLSRVTPYKSDASVSNGTNSPDGSYPYNATTWYVRAGGYPNYCFRAFALCAE